VLAPLVFRDGRIRQRLQFDNGRRTIDAPQVNDIAPARNTARQGQNLGLCGSLVFSEFHLERDLVTTKPCGFLVELGGFGARGIQLAAQFAIACLQHLKEPDVLKTLGMEFLP